MRVLAASVLLLVATSTNLLAQPPADSPRPKPLEVRSSAFGMNGTIPSVYTCDGANISPPLWWSPVPKETQSIAIIVEDPDAPQGTFVHWLVLGIPPIVKELPSGAALPYDAVAATNDAGAAGYAGPCPPSGTHHYHFHVYALDFPLAAVATRADFMMVIKDHIVAHGELVGVYERQPRR
jgi:hypothetical protein